MARLRRYRGKTIALICTALLLAATSVLLADEHVRQVQEELRKRNLYFGDVDGRPSTELEAALKRYQARKGFEPSGTVDADTAASLHIAGETEPAEVRSRIPAEPILRSDAARQLPEGERVALLQKAEENPDATPTVAPPAESPPPAQNLTPERVTKFVEDYLRDGETSDVQAQVRYFSFPVKFFDYGERNLEFVARDTTSYVKRWPERKYMLTGPVTFSAGSKEDETLVEFMIAYDLKRKPHYQAEGQTRNWWTIRPEGDDLKIVAIREERVRK